MTKLEKAYQVESKSGSNFTKEDILVYRCPHDYGMKDDGARTEDEHRCTRIVERFKVVTCERCWNKEVDDE